MEEEINKKEIGYWVSVQWDEVDRVRKGIDKTLKKANVHAADALVALCIAAIEEAYNSNISKPQLLMKISQWWEELDSQVNKGG